MNAASPLRRRIVGIDGSAAGIAALRWAAQRCTEDGAPLILAHVAPSMNTRSSSVFDDARALVQADHAGLRLEAVLLEGTVWEALNRTAKPDDVIVIGTDKTGHVHGRVSGVLSIQLAMTARCAVAVIPDIDLSFRRGIVAGIGRPSTAPQVADAAYAVARRRLVPLTLVHGGCVEHCTDGLDAAEKSLVGHDPVVDVRRRILSTPPADALLDVARDKELLVLGRGSRSASGSLIGATTHTVLMNATSPILLLAPA